MEKEILKEIACYIGCIVFIALCGYFSGFFKVSSFETFSNTVITYAKSTGIEKYINQERSPRKKVAVYKNYRPTLIPKAVLKGSETSGTWKNIFNSNQKVVFYLYDNNDEFHNKLYEYFSQNKLYEKYNFEPYDLHAFNNIRLGATGSNKICNSFDECNEVRKKASDYSILSNFLSNCGKTMCVFNPSENTYIRLKKRNITDAEKLLDGLQNW